MSLRDALPVGAATLAVFAVGCADLSPASHSGRQDYNLVGLYEDQAAQDIALGVGELGTTFASTTPAGLAKSLSEPSTASLNLAGQAWTYLDGWWSRNGELSLTGTDGAQFLISGIDSVQYLDATSAVIRNPLIDLVSAGNASRHCRLYVRGNDGGYVDVKTDYTLNGTITRAADTTLVLSGSVNLWIDAETGNKARWCTVTTSAAAAGVTFTRTAGAWSKPLSGSVSIDGVYKSAAITFSNGTATIVITDKSGAVSPRTIYVTL
jgi:hypothetical protein